MIYKPQHPNAKKDGYVYHHRYVVSEFLGRPLKTTEHIHHKNGDGHDNNLENLQIVTSRKEHKIAHNPLWANPNHRKEYKRSYREKHREEINQYMRKYRKEWRAKRRLLGFPPS